ncbi:unnamed protein product [Prorocentrum cordatum]|uniref:DJ-1/PfpI domain-containing protein n=1 Tax=Prorocentrum cordatum TaxID=2364126 RepID=A0ABN9XCL5_9DINO|nr:unnamed protein product [Polarella glacialis]
MQVAMAHPLTFPTPLDACCEPLKIDVLQQLSSKRLVIQSDQANYRIGLDGQGMAVGLSVRSVRGGEGKQQARAARPDAAALLKQDTANSAREYLESHGLLRYVQALLHAVIQVRPEDPYEFMREQLTAGQDGPSAVHAAAAPPPAMAAEAARAPAGETAAPAEAAPPPPQEEADAPPPPPLAPPSPPKRPTGVKPPAAEPPTLEVEPADAAAEAAGSPPEVAEEAARGTRSSPEAPCYGDQHEAPPLPSQGITLEEFRAQTLDALKVARENGTLEAHLERALGRQPSQEATAVAAALEAAEAAPPAAEAAVPGSARPEARAAGAVAPAEAPAAGAGAAGGGATGRALLVVTSAALLGGHPCGLWSEACTGPYFLFKDAGYSVRVVSIAGGDVPVDRSSLSATFKTENDVRMDNEAVNPLKGTGKLADEDASQYDIILFAGGHGACVDFSTEEVGNFVSRAAELGKVLAAVCHGTVALVHATVATQEGGERAPLVKGRNVACFSDAEEEQIQLAGTVPFLVEAKLKELGALVENVDPWADLAGGRLATTTPYLPTL